MNPRAPFKFAPSCELPSVRAVRITSNTLLDQSPIPSMRKVFGALLLSAAATGVAALLLEQLDLDAARPVQDAGFPGPNPDNIAEEDVEMMLNELASQL